MKTLISITALVLVLLTVTGCNAGIKVPDHPGTYAEIKTSKGDILIRLFQDTPITTDNFVRLAEGTKEWKDPSSGNLIKKPFYNGLIFHRVIKDFMIQGGCPLGNGTGGPGYAFQDECFEKGDQITGKLTSEADAILAFNQILRPYLTANFGQQDNPVYKLFLEIQRAGGKVTPLLGKTVEELQKIAETDKPVFRNGAVLHPVHYGSLAMANSGPDSNGSQFFIVTKQSGTPWLNGKHTVFGEVIEGMKVAHAIESVETGAQDRPVKPITIKSIIIHRVE